MVDRQASIAVELGCTRQGSNGTGESTQWVNGLTMELLLLLLLLLRYTNIEEGGLRPQPMEQFENERTPCAGNYIVQSS